MKFLYGKPTGVHRANGMPHRQPTALRRGWCLVLHGRHHLKFGACPSFSCIYCGHWPENLR